MKTWPLGTALKRVFIAYIALGIAFGYVYEKLYESDNGNFAFAREVLNTRTQRLRSDLEADIRASSTILEVYQRAEPLVKQMVEPVAPVKVVGTVWDVVTIASGDRNVEFWLAPGPYVGRQDMRYRIDDMLDVSDIGSGTRLHSQVVTIVGPSAHREGERSADEDKWFDGYSWGRSRGLYEQMIAGGIRDLSDTISSKRAQLSMLSLDVPKGVSWNRLDFFYFSFITQATVGYGDILPNSTTVRVVVMLQIVLSTALLVFVVTMFVSTQSQLAIQVNRNSPM